MTGCSLPHIADMGSPKGANHPKTANAHASARTASPTPSPSPTASPTSVAASQAAVHRSTAGGDLAAGSLTHELDAGQYKLVVNYWSTQDPATWTANQTSVLQLAAHIENGDVFHRVLVSRFFATMDDGTNVTTLSDDRGAFVLTPPYSYNTGLRIRPTDHNATGATICVEFDLLVETTPLSGQYFRQTVLDTIHLQFAPEGTS